MLCPCGTLAGRPRSCVWQSGEALVAGECRHLQRGFVSVCRRSAVAIGCQFNWGDGGPKASTWQPHLEQLLTFLVKRLSFLFFPSFPSTFLFVTLNVAALRNGLISNSRYDASAWGGWLLATCLWDPEDVFFLQLPLGQHMLQLCWEAWHGLTLTQNVLIWPHLWGFAAFPHIVL